MGEAVGQVAIIIIIVMIARVEQVSLDKLEGRFGCSDITTAFTA